jgi:phosphoribosyl 1,2-cyclic phosphodiesterase
MSLSVHFREAVTYCSPPTRVDGGEWMEITFYGVRGSTPCAGEGTARYGGNTASVVLRDEGAEPILLDLGTGLRYFGVDHPANESLHAHALVTHLHWDHVQGLPFCQPLLVEGSTLVVYGPEHEGVGFGEAFAQLMRPPFFPVTVEELPGEISFVTLAEGEHVIAGAIVTALEVPHTDTTFGYRVERNGVSIAYVSDHQQPADSTSVSDAVIELCRDVDVLIHDAQYTPDEFAKKPTWGHCTVAYAVRVAAASGARRLVLFHHDPSHDDATLDRLAAEAVAIGSGLGVDDIVSAHEGLTITVA